MKQNETVRYKWSAHMDMCIRWLGGNMADIQTESLMYECRQSLPHTNQNKQFR
jgi:hypothetical protein